MTAGGNRFKNATAHKVNSYYTLAISYCIFCVGKHTILGPVLLFKSYTKYMTNTHNKVEKKREKNIQYQLQHKITCAGSQFKSAGDQSTPYSLQRSELVMIRDNMFIYYTVYAHVKSFTIVKNRKCGVVKCWKCCSYLVMFLV